MAKWISIIVFIVLLSCVTREKKRVEPSAKMADQVQRVIEKDIKSILKCYERQLQTQRELKGSLVFTWAINDKGRVQDINVVEGSFRSDTMEACIGQIISKFRFKRLKKGHIANIRYPFHFKPDAEIKDEE